MSVTRWIGQWIRVMWKVVFYRKKTLNIGDVTVLCDGMSSLGWLLDTLKDTISASFSVENSLEDLWPDYGMSHKRLTDELKLWSGHPTQLNSTKVAFGRTTHRSVLVTTPVLPAVRRRRFNNLTTWIHTRTSVRLLWYLLTSLTVINNCEDYWTDVCHPFMKSLIRFNLENSVHTKSIIQKLCQWLTDSSKIFICTWQEQWSKLTVRQHKYSYKSWWSSPIKQMHCWIKETFQRNTDWKMCCCYRHTVAWIISLTSWVKQC